MKILIVSHNSFSQTHNNGKTLSAIFSAFKKEELCQLYFTPIGKPDYERCENYYLISDKDAIRSIFIRSHCGTSTIKTNESINVVSNRIKPNNVTKVIRTAVWLFSSWYHGGLGKWIAKQNPDIIFYVGGDGIFSHRIAVSLSKKLTLPLVSYFTDDYVINPPTNFYNRLLKHYYKKTIRCSSLLYAIGGQMALSYSNYYNRPFLPIMNIVTIPAVEPVYNPQPDLLRINYFGGLHLGRAEEILKFVIFLQEEVSPFLKKDVEVGVYTFSNLPQELKMDYELHGIRLHKALVGSELEYAMCETDLFLHVESIEPNFKYLTLLSVSTKIPEYMSKNRPIIAFGPKEVASFGVIESAMPELVIDDNGYYKNMSHEIAVILNDEAKLSGIAHRGFEFAKQHFDINIVSTTFRNQLEKLFKEYYTIN